MKDDEKKIDWNHVYLLGWYHNGNSYLTTWVGELPYIYVIVTGPVLPYGPPIWKAEKSWRDGSHYSEFGLHEVDLGDWTDEKAKEMNGVRAIGWYIEKGFEREEPEQWKEWADKSKYV